MDTKREHRTHVEGSPRGNPYDLTYSPSGRLIGKSRDNNSVTLSVSVDMAYGYCDDYQPHAAKRMFEFTGKELDAETGYGYFGARYMDHELMTGWLSVDPMSDKYPNISPYAYCAWNPVKLVDPNGREWDLSALSTQQQELFYSNMNGLCERSPLFNEIYCALSESEVVYKPNIGETQSDDIDAQYNPKDHTFTFVDESSLSSGHAYIEEMIHAYQLTENSNKYDASLDFNYEFEAKVIKNLIQWESGGVAPIPGMESMQSIIQNDYEFGSKLDFPTVTSESFANAYRTNANNYATYNIMNNIGNSNYHTPTNQSPASLNLLLQKVRP